mgnify:CR=1 FL=1
MLKILDSTFQVLAYLNHIQDDILIREIINGEYTLSFKGNIEELKTVYLYDENNLLISALVLILFKIVISLFFCILEWILNFNSLSFL